MILLVGLTMVMQGSNLETKAALQTNMSMVRNITRCRLKPFWVLRKISVNLQREFMKHVISLILHLLLLLLLLQ